MNASSELAITLSCGAGRGQGRNQALDGADPIASYAAILKAHCGPDAWYSQGVYRNGHRSIEDWRSASAVTGDLDYDDGTGAEHVTPPAEFRAAVEAALADLPGSIAYFTPHGLRVDFVFSAPVFAPADWQRASVGVAALLTKWLRRHRLDADKTAGLAGLRACGATTRQAQFMFGPTIQNPDRTFERAGGQNGGVKRESRPGDHPAAPTFFRGPTAIGRLR